MGILDVVLFTIVATIINYCIAFIYAKIHRKK